MDVRPVHGVTRAYTGGCRCPRCRRAWTEYMRAYREQRRSARGVREAKDVRATAAIVSRAIDAEQDAVKIPMSFSPLAGQILVAIQQRTGRKRGEIVDELLRAYGAELIETAA